MAASPSRTAPSPPSPRGALLMRTQALQTAKSRSTRRRASPKKASSLAPSCTSHRRGRFAGFEGRIDTVDRTRLSACHGHYARPFTAGHSFGALRSEPR
jgi:hypothetical protein